MHKKLKIGQIIIGIVISMSLLPVACNQGNSIEITDAVHYNLHDTPELIETKGCIEYDSVTFSDASYAVRLLKYAPQNTLTRYVDAKGRQLATISAASETFAQCLVYGYDDKDRLKYLLRFDELREPEFRDETTDSAYLHFRLAIDSVDFSNPDTTRHTLIEIKYSDGGYVNEIKEIPTGKSIIAPDRYKIEVKVEQCTGFWSSDLTGGRYLLKTDIVPIFNEKDSYFIKRFVDLIPAIEMHYANGRLFKSVCHPNPSYPHDVKVTTTCKTEAGMNIYTILYGNSTDTLTRIWKDGRLQEEILKSKWGTVLNTKHYNYLSSNKVRREESNFDFKTRTMKPTVVTILHLSDMPLEKDEMDPLQGESWMEAY